MPKERDPIIQIISLISDLAQLNLRVSAAHNKEL